MIRRTQNSTGQQCSKWDPKPRGSRFCLNTSILQNVPFALSRSEVPEEVNGPHGPARSRAVPLARPRAAPGGVSALLVSPDGLSIYSASWDNTIGVWNRVTGVLTFRMPVAPHWCAGERMGSWTGHTASGVQARSPSKPGIRTTWAIEVFFKNPKSNFGKKRHSPGKK